MIAATFTLLALFASAFSCNRNHEQHQTVPTEATQSGDHDMSNNGEFQGQTSKAPLGLIKAPQNATLLGLRAIRNSQRSGWTTIWFEREAEGHGLLTTRSLTPQTLGEPAVMSKLVSPCHDPALAIASASTPEPTILCLDHSGDETKVRAQQGGATTDLVVGTPDGHHEEATRSLFAIRAGDPPEGTIVWIAKTGELRHACHGEGDEQLCRTEVVNSQESLKVAVFREGRTKLHTISEWASPPNEGIVGPMVRASSGQEVILWNEMQSGGASYVLHVVKIDGRRDLIRLQREIPSDYRQVLSMALSPSGSVISAHFARGHDEEPDRVGLFGFDRDGTPQELRSFEAAVAWPESATLFECGGMLWFAHIHLDEESRLAQLRLTRIPPSGPIEHLPPLWTGRRPVPEGAAPLNDNVELFSSCNDGQAAVVGLANMPEGYGLIFAEWGARY